MPAKKAKSLGDQFKDAKARVEKLPARPSNDRLLDLYGLFKQATEGDVAGPAAQSTTRGRRRRASRRTTR